MRSKKTKAEFFNDQLAQLESENAILKNRINELTHDQDEWETKVWGKVQHIFISAYASISQLCVEANYNCSIHMHEHRANLFIIHSGKVCIEDWSPYPSQGGTFLCTTTFLGKDEHYLARSGRYHRFRVIESGRMTEIYFPDGGIVRQEDIIRKNVGGADNLFDLKTQFPERF